MKLTTGRKAEPPGKASSAERIQYREILTGQLCISEVLSIIP